MMHNMGFELVRDVIRRYASEDNPIDQNTIVKILQSDPNTFCERKTVTRALDKLRTLYGREENGTWCNEEIRLHYEVVHRSSSDIYKQYWFEYTSEEKFTDEELMFLMDSVQFSRHVPQNFAQEIVKKLLELSPNRYSGKFELFGRLNERNIPVRHDFFIILDTINGAIHHRRKISFFVNEFGTDKKLHPVSDEPVVVKPYRIVISDGFYYLLCCKMDSSVIKSIRVDKITDVVVSDEEYRFSKAQEQAMFRPNEYIIEHRYMNSGEAVNVTLEIDKAILGDAIDSFGENIVIDPAADSYNRLTIHVDSSEKDIIDWAIRYGEYAVIVDPEYLRYEVLDRMQLISEAYRENDSDINYLELIKTSENIAHRLILRNVDLNGRESYKHLKALDVAMFHHNGIRDFSFLPSYKVLRELIISHNEISDPGVLSKMSRLKSLGLVLTGITDLNFLKGLKKLRKLSLREYSIENVEAIYHMPELKILTVNKPIAKLIDEERLKKVYGESFEYNIENYRGISFYSRRRMPARNRDDSDRYERLLKAYSMCELKDKALRKEICSKIYSGSNSLRLCGTKEFALVEAACDSDERLAMYKNISHYAGNDYIWFVTYEGEPAREIDLNKIYEISIFKREHGLKMIAMVRRERQPFALIGKEQLDFRDFREKCYYAEAAHIKRLIDEGTGWFEVSRELSYLFSRICTMDDVIDPSVLIKHKVFKGIVIDTDKYHYNRLGSDGTKTAKKMAFGVIELK